MHTKTSRTRIYVLGAVAALGFTVLGGCHEENGDIRTSGTVEAREVVVSAKVGGEIVEMAVEEGSRVGKGDVIARVDDQDLRLERNRARAGVKHAEAKLSLLLEGAAPEDVRQAEEAVRQAEEEYRLARVEFERVARLHEAGSISDSDYDTAQARANQARARLNSARAALDKASGPARPAELEVGRAQLEQAEVALELAERKLQYAEVSAPIGGTVVTTAREEGELVAAGRPIAELADLSVVFVNVYVSEARLAGLRIGAQAEVLPDGTDRTLTGRVVYISPRAEFTPSNVQTDEERAKLVYRVKVRVVNSEGVLKIGMPVDVVLPDREAEAERG